MFIAGVIDTGNKLFSVHGCQWHWWLILVTNFQWLLVSLIPAINLSLVSLTLVKNLRQVFDQGVSGVYGCSFSWRFNETISGHAANSFGGLRGLWSEYVRCRLWMCLFIAVPMTPFSVVSDPGSRKYRCLLPVSSVRNFAERTDIVTTVYRWCQWPRDTIFPRCSWYMPSPIALNFPTLLLL